MMFALFEPKVKRNLTIGFGRRLHDTANSRISRRIGGRPGRCPYVQRFAIKRRCQRSSVAGVTTKDRQRSRGRNRLAAARKSRSAHVSVGAVGSSPKNGEFVPKHDDFEVFEFELKGSAIVGSRECDVDMPARVFSWMLTAVLFVPVTAESPRATASRPTVAIEAARLRAQLSLETLVRDWYEREFGETIPWPAIFNDDRAVDCRGEGHLTTTAYLRTSETTADLLVLYLTRDGLNLIKKSRAHVLVPAGRFRILSVVVRHPDTVGADPLSMWQGAQEQVNNQHTQFARDRGYAAPLVAFANTNLVLEPRELTNPENPRAIAAAIESRRLSPADYDILLLINIDPSRSEGGWSSLVGQRSIYVGNFARWTTALGADDWNAIARTAYQQLMAYHWGWQPDWTPTCGGTRIGYEPFITAPRLFGWEDVDGDGVPEIIDHTPYGRPR